MAHIFDESDDPRSIDSATIIGSTKMIIWLISSIVLCLIIGIFAAVVLYKFNSISSKFQIVLLCTLVTGMFGFCLFLAVWLVDTWRYLKSLLPK